MKKIIITTALVLISFLSFSQNKDSNLKVEAQKMLNRVTQNNIWVLDTTYGFSGQGSTSWDFDQTEIVISRNDKGLPTEIILTEKTEGTASWINVYQSVFSYFDNDSVFEYKVKEWNTQTNSWNSQLSFYDKYNEDGVLLENFVRNWDNDEQYFYQGNQELYTYDASGLVTIKQDKDWNNGSWENYLKTLYTYDDNNNDTLELQQMYVGYWRDNWKIKKTYNELNQLTLSYERGYDSYWAEWFEYSKTYYTYYENGLIKDEFTERYNTDNLEWYDLARTNYYYNENNLLEYKEEYDLDEINNSLKYEYQYNSNLDETNFKLYSYNAPDDWTKFYEVFDTYDENFNQTSFYSLMLDGNWNNFLKEEYYWHTFQTSSIPTNNYELVISPNPVSDILNIQTSNDVFIQIFNSAGVLQLSTSETEINVSSLKKGIYLVLIKNENYNLTRKIIIE